MRFTHIGWSNEVDCPRVRHLPCVPDHPVCSLKGLHIKNVQTLFRRPRRSRIDMYNSPLLSIISEALMQPQHTHRNVLPIGPSSRTPSRPSQSFFLPPTVRTYLFFFVCQTVHTVSPHLKPINQSIIMKPTRNPKRNCKEESCCFPPHTYLSARCLTPFEIVWKQINSTTDLRLARCLLTHRAPVSHKEVFGQRVEGEVAAGAFGVVVGTREAGG